MHRSVFLPFLCFALLNVYFTGISFSAEPSAKPVVINLWEGNPPGPAAKTDGEERDLAKPTDRLVGGKTVMKLGHVSQPQVHVYLPPADKANGAAVVICPGGGYSILAWDLEGTEVAEWLNSIGVAAVLLKYRVPSREQGDAGKWLGPVMDAQRALSITRSKAKEWKIDPQRVGILGFSAGGETAARAAMKNGERLYEATDTADTQPCAANFAVLVYPAYIADDAGQLKADYVVTKSSPPTFFVHAADDRVKCESSTCLFGAGKQAGVPAELHIYSTGGHGYGLRPTTEAVTHWPQRASQWLKERNLLTSP